jgi:hypothetical protein
MEALVTEIKMPTLNHTHSMRFFKKRKDELGEIFEVYMCFDPKCTYTVEKQGLFNKLNKCGCGREWILSLDDLRRRLPKCLACSNTSKAKQFQKAKQIMESLVLDNTDNSELPEFMSKEDSVEVELRNILGD